MIRPAKITWAATVLLLGSGIALALGIFALSIPDADRTISIVAVAVGACGIVTGTGLFRLWCWARISALILGGLSAYVGLVLLAMIPFFEIPVPPNLQGQIATEAATKIAMEMKIALVIVFFLSGAIGSWWVYLFSSSSIKELFGSSTTTRSRPFKFSVVGWYFIMTAILGIWSLWQGVGHKPPILMEFGSLVIGWGALVVSASYIAVQLFLGTGLLRGRGKSRILAIYYLLFGCLDVIVFLLRPGREARISTYYAIFTASRPTFDMYLSKASWSQYMKTASIEWAIFALVAIWFLAGWSEKPDPAKE